MHVAALSGERKLVRTSGAALTMKWGGEIRAFVVKHEMDDMPADNYYGFTLFGKELSYDVDISTVGCSCNAALFFASMPGYNRNGTIAHGDLNPYYCDANKVGGVWCWEHDTIESNMYTMATTPHTCEAPPGGYIASCDRAGCGTNAHRKDPAGMCPDARCRIDTRRLFRVVQRYGADEGAGALVRITNRLVQGNSTFEWDACERPGYLAQMTHAFQGKMTMVFQLWGDSHARMSWLDSMTGCTGRCNNDTAEVTFSNIAIASLPAQPEVVAYV